MTTALPPLALHTIKIEPFTNSSALDHFHCGERDIDRSLNKCRDWQSKNRVRMFCAMTDGCDRAYGFYCLGVSATETRHLDGDIVRGSEDRSFVPFIYLNYLAVEKDHQRQRLGELMLLNALERCEVVGRNVGVYGVALHALNDHSAGLYDRYGFRAYGNRDLPFMVLPIKSVFDLFST